MFSRLFTKADRDLSPSELERRIEQRRKQAVKSGVANALLELYFEDWRFLPSSIQRTENSDFCHPWITEAKEDTTEHRIELKVKGQTYVITTRDQDPMGDDCDTRKELELSIDGSLCLGISVKIEYGEYADTESLSYVTAFVPGAWVNDVLLLAKQTKLQAERQMKQLRTRMTKDEAKRFGL